VRAECALRDHPTRGRRLTQQANGRLKINTQKVKAEQRLDGKYLIATSDPHINTEDAALGYKNLLEAERGFCDLKSTLLLRPVFHRLGGPDGRMQTEIGIGTNLNFAGPCGSPTMRRSRSALLSQPSFAPGDGLDCPPLLGVPLRRCRVGAGLDQ